MSEYTTVELVMAELGGGGLTADQVRQVERLIRAARATIGEYTGRYFLSGAPITDEWIDEPGSLVRVAYYPFETVEAVSGRIDERLPYQALVLGTDWEVASPDRGLIRLLGYGHRRRWYAYDPVLAGHRSLRRFERVLVSYTPTDMTDMVSDAALLARRAATLLVAGWLSASTGGMAGQAGDIKSYSIPGDMAVTFRDPPPGQRLPADVLAVLAPLIPLVAFA